MSRRRAAEALGVRQRDLAAWEAQGLLPSMDVATRRTCGGRPRYRREDIERLRADMQRESLADLVPWR